MNQRVRAARTKHAVAIGEGLQESRNDSAADRDCALLGRSMQQVIEHRSNRARQRHDLRDTDNARLRHLEDVPAKRFASRRHDQMLFAGTGGIHEVQPRPNPIERLAVVHRTQIIGGGEVREVFQKQLWSQRLRRDFRLWSELREPTGKPSKYSIRDRRQPTSRPGQLSESSIAQQRQRELRGSQNFDPRQPVPRCDRAAQPRPNFTRRVVRDIREQQVLRSRHQLLEQFDSQHFRAVSRIDEQLARHRRTNRPPAKFHLPSNSPNHAGQPAVITNTHQPRQLRVRMWRVDEDARQQLLDHCAHMRCRFGVRSLLRRQ